MALTIFQESIPFSNERLEQEVSQNGTYNNPIVMPLSFDIVQYSNTVETIFYLRNDDTRYYYENVAIYLARKKTTRTSPNDPNDQAEISKATPGDPLFINMPIVENGNTELQSIMASYSSDIIPSFTTPLHGVKRYEELIGTDGTSNEIFPRFSFGYDELSNIDWSLKQPGLIIAGIGNTNMPDTSYIPIRLRIEIKMEALPVYTLRDYSIGIAYGDMKEIGA